MRQVIYLLLLVIIGMGCNQAPDHDYFKPVYVDTANANGIVIPDSMIAEMVLGDSLIKKQLDSIKNQRDSIAFRKR